MRWTSNLGSVTGACSLPNAPVDMQQHEGAAHSLILELNGWRQLSSDQLGSLLAKADCLSSGGGWEMDEH